MRRKILFILLLFFILITSYCVVNASTPTSIEYNGFTYDLSGLEIYSKTFVYYNSYANKVVVVTASDSATVTGWENGFSISGYCKLYYFKKGVNRLDGTTVSHEALGGSGNSTANMIYSNFDIYNGGRQIMV